MYSLIVAAVLLVVSWSYPTGHIGDNVEARRLFFKVDKNTDQHLSTDEFHTVFFEFDLDSSKTVDANEFVTDWAIRDLGPSTEAIVLFHNLDVDGDGLIKEHPDLKYIFEYFDHDHNGRVSEAEFVVQWQKMSLS